MCDFDLVNSDGDGAFLKNVFSCVTPSTKIRLTQASQRSAISERTHPTYLIPEVSALFLWKLFSVSPTICLQMK